MAAFMAQADCIIRFSVATPWVFTQDLGFWVSRLGFLGYGYQSWVFGRVGYIIVLGNYCEKVRTKEK